MSTAPAIPMDTPVSIVVKVDHATWISTVHEAGDPVGGFLQLVSDGCYVAVEFESADAVGKVIDALVDVHETLAAAEARLEVVADALTTAMTDYHLPSGPLVGP